jgi:hypothetical protein
MKPSLLPMLVVAVVVAVPGCNASGPDPVDPPPVVTPVSYSGLVGYWRFDEGGGTIAADSSPLGNAGNLRGGAMWARGGFPQPRFANPGSLLLDGVDGRVALGVRGLPAAEAPKTISLWINYVIPPIGAAQVLSLAGSSGCGIQLGFRDGRLGVSSGATQLVGVTAPRSRWHHWVYTYDGTNHRIVLDGLISPSASAAVPRCAVTEAVAGSAPGGQEAFLGSLDDLRIYDRVLTDAEIAVLAQGAEPARTTSAVRGLRPPGVASVTGPLAEKLTAYWPLDEGTGAITGDLSGSDNLGTLAGAPTWTAGGFPGARFDNPFSLTLNGTVDQVELLGNRLPAIDQNLSISLWFNYATQPMSGNRAMLSLTSTTELCGLQVGTRGTNLAVSLRGSPVVVLVSTPAPPPGWHHLVYTHDGTTQSLYLDGAAPITTSNASVVCKASEGAIGNFLSGRDHFVGQLDDIRVWSQRTLSAEDVAALFAGAR